MFSPAADRNKEPIGEVLKDRLPKSGVLLEIACGALQHASHLAPRHPDLIWQPSDINSEAIAHGRAIPLTGNIREPIYLDVLDDSWPITSANVIYSANLMHISPPGVPSALFRGAQKIGVSDVFIYGPFIVTGHPTAEGNVRFDADLRNRNPDWGIRELSKIEAAAALSDFRMIDSVTMPANNLFLHFTCVASISQSTVSVETKQPENNRKTTENKKGARS